MSDIIKHECGVALIRLRKPLEYYRKKYGTPLYGLKKLYLLMEKQHNRGQDGAGVASIALDQAPGRPFISRRRSNSNRPIADIFQAIFEPYRKLEKTDPKKLSDMNWLKANVKFAGEVLLGHLRYGTHGKNSIEQWHPVLRMNNWRTRNLLLAGNFNMTNNDDLFQQLIELGQHPKEDSDTVTVLEKIGHFLDVENQRLFDQYKVEEIPNREISGKIAANLDIQRILERSVKDFDGGYTIAGLIGHGDAFVMRDPNGIRPAFYYYDDEVAVVASERPAIQTCFNVQVVENVQEIQPGHALIIRKDGTITEERISEPAERRSCSFERIYFSRGSDRDIYVERKELGYLLTDAVLKAINYDLENTVFSFIPNTSEVAFLGLQTGLKEYIARYKKEKIKKIGVKGKAADAELDKILNICPRVEKLAIKDVKLRTFITEDEARDELVSHVYDVTYGLIRNNVDTIVALDDSIVRGTTLRQSILYNLDRLCPKKIIIVSSAPQIRYPDCYGIDMSRMKDFIAFRAAVALLEERNQEELLDEIYIKCKEHENEARQETNFVKQLYDQFTDEDISNKISQIIKNHHIQSEVQVIYQTIDDLHIACPSHIGDWYFSGNFPTPGGNKVVNRAFMNYMEGIGERAY